MKKEIVKGYSNLQGILVQKISKVSKGNVTDKVLNKVVGYNNV